MKPSLNKFISTFLFACVIVATGLTVYIASNPPPGDSFSEFYVLGPSGQAAGYPTNLMVGESGTVILGVINHEYENVTYSIVIRLENNSIATINDLILKHKEGWEKRYTFSPERAGERMKIEFILYKNGVKEIYRNIHLWITVRAT